MLTLLFALQTLTPQGTLEDRIAAFAKGDSAARDEVLKAGACSIPALRKVRHHSPERVDALVYELKKAAAGFEAGSLITLLDAKRSIETGEGTFFKALDELSQELPLLFDPTLFRSHWERKVTLTANNRQRREILESFCRQTDLDYGFFYGVLLIAEPGRLWPAAPPWRTTALTEGESEQAARLIDRLSSERGEERDQAHAALRKLGKGVLPLLEKAATGGDAERRTRCREIILDFGRPPRAATFHEPAAKRQKLAGADLDLRKSLEEGQVSFKVSDIVLDGAMRLLLQPRQIPFQLAPALRTVRLTLDLQNHSAWAVVSMATHAFGFDFLILDGKLVIDSREEIERLLPSGR